MEIFDKARELGMAVVESEAYKRLKDAEAAQETDGEAMKLLKEYSDLRTKLGKEVQSGEPTPERIEEIRALVNEKYDTVAAHPVIKEYMEAKNEFDLIMQQMNTILSYFINGEDASSCGGDCSSCGGCH